MKKKSLFAKFPEISLAFQYGSSVKKNFHQAKDVDVAVLFKTEPTAKRRLEIQLNLAEALKEFYGKEIDIAILNTASPFLAYQVIKYGRPIYGDKKRRCAFVVRTLTRYFDALFLHQFFIHRLEKKLGVAPHG